MALLLDSIKQRLSFLRRQEFRKIKASTLVETIVASIIIIVIFSIASLALNNIFKTTVANTNASIDAELSKLYYLYEHHKINETYASDFNGWKISIIKQSNNSKTIEAKNLKTNKVIAKIVPNEAIQ